MCALAIFTKSILNHYIQTYSVISEGFHLLSLEQITQLLNPSFKPGDVFCNAPVEGQLGGESLIDTVADINEAECENLCDVEEQCQFFTFHFSNSTVYPSTCFLLREIQEPIVPCQDETCTSGSPNCENSLCGFLQAWLPNGDSQTLRL